MLPFCDGLALVWPSGTNGWVPLYNEVRPYDFRSSCAPRPDRSRISQCNARRRRVWRRRWHSGSGRVRPRQEPTSPSKVTSSSGPARTPPGIIQDAGRRVQRPHPNGQGHLPRAARRRRTQQRQQMIQNTQIKNPKMGVLSVDVVWTAEFAAKGYVEALPPDQFPTDGMLKATVDSGDLLRQAVRPTRAPPTAACCTTARTCSRSTTCSHRPPSTR